MKTKKKSLFDILEKSGVVFSAEICGHLYDEECGRGCDVYQCTLAKGARRFTWEHRASFEQTKHKEPPSLYCALSELNLWPVKGYRDWLAAQGRDDSAALSRLHEKAQFQHAALLGLLGQRRLEDLRILL